MGTQPFPLLGVALGVLPLFLSLADCVEILIDQTPDTTQRCCTSVRRAGRRRTSPPRSVARRFAATSAAGAFFTRSAPPRSSNMRRGDPTMGLVPVIRRH